MRFLLPWALACSAVSAYTWKNVKIGGGGGFTPGIVFNPTKQGVAYARTDIGGLYRLNTDDSWTPLTDFADSNSWHDWGVWSVATDPVSTSNVYIAVGMYTNSWDPNVGSILRSSDQGTTWAETKLPFKLPGNQPGRGLGERLVVDPANNKILFFGTPSGNGLYKSTDSGVTWAKVSTFTAVGDFKADASDTTGYQSDLIGLTSIVFDTTSGTTGGATSRIFIGTATTTGSSVWVSNDAGATWTAVAGQPTGRFPHRMKFSAAEKLLYITFGNTAGPYDAGDGTVYKYSTTSSTWTNITPAWEAANSLTFGYGGLALDAKVPGTLMVAADNLWYPDVQIFRSTDSGATWTNIWDYNNNHYTYNTNKAPWINASRGSTDTKVLGWMVASLEIDPFDSNHWLYGTGLTVYGGHDLTSWPAVTVQSLADGIEETSVQALISIPGGTPLLSAVADDGGFVHKSLDVSPSVAFINPSYPTVKDLDFAGQKVANIVRVGNDGSAGVSQLAISSDGGATWSSMTLSSTSSYGGKVAYSADGTTIVWATASTGAYRFVNNVQSTITLATGVVLAADKVNAKYFYAADQNSVYVSSDGGATFTTVSLSTGGANSIEVHPTVAGDVWLGGSSGLWHSTDFGKTWTKSTSVTTAYAIAIGKGAGSYPNVYGFVATSAASVTLQVSADQGATWTVISDAQHGFGAASADCLAASMDTAGLVFVGTNGRGIFYGTGTVSSGTTTSKASSTVASSTAASSTTSKPVTTSTTLATSTTKAATSTSSSAVATSTAAVVTKYGQCGGSGWTGGTVCASGSTCQVQNPYYSQCL